MSDLICNSNGSIWGHTQCCGRRVPSTLPLPHYPKHHSSLPIQNTIEKSFCHDYLQIQSHQWNRRCRLVAIWGWARDSTRNKFDLVWRGWHPHCRGRLGGCFEGWCGGGGLRRGVILRNESGGGRCLRLWGCVWWILEFVYVILPLLIIYFNT